MKTKLHFLKNVIFLAGANGLRATSREGNIETWYCIVRLIRFCFGNSSRFKLAMKN